MPRRGDLDDDVGRLLDDRVGDRVHPDVGSAVPRHCAHAWISLDRAANRPLQGSFCPVVTWIAPTFRRARRARHSLLCRVHAVRNDSHEALWSRPQKCTSNTPVSHHENSHDVFTWAPLLSPGARCAMPANGSQVHEFAPPGPPPRRGIRSPPRAPVRPSPGPRNDPHAGRGEGHEQRPDAARGEGAALQVHPDHHCPRTAPAPGARAGGNAASARPARSPPAARPPARPTGKVASAKAGARQGRDAPRPPTAKAAAAKAATAAPARRRPHGRHEARATAEARDREGRRREGRPRPSRAAEARRRARPPPPSPPPRRPAATEAAAAEATRRPSALQDGPPSRRAAVVRSATAVSDADAGRLVRPPPHKRTRSSSRLPAAVSPRRSRRTAEPAGPWMTAAEPSRPLPPARVRRPAVVPALYLAAALIGALGVRPLHRRPRPLRPTATVSHSVSVAEELGIEAAPADGRSPPEPPERLGELAVSRNDRDADQAARRAGQADGPTARPPQRPPPRRPAPKAVLPGQRRPAHQRLRRPLGHPARRHRPRGADADARVRGHGRRRARGGAGQRLRPRRLHPARERRRHRLRPHGLDPGRAPARSSRPARRSRCSATAASPPARTCTSRCTWAVSTARRSTRSRGCGTRGVRSDPAALPLDAPCRSSGRGRRRWGTLRGTAARRREAAMGHGHTPCAGHRCRRPAPPPGRRPRPHPRRPGRRGRRRGRVRLAGPARRRRAHGDRRGRHRAGARRGHPRPAAGPRTAHLRLAAGRDPRRRRERPAARSSSRATCSSRRSAGSATRRRSSPG